MIFKLGWIGDGFAVLTHISKGAGEQVGVAFFTKTKNHRGTHIKGVASPFEAATRSTGYQITLQHKHLGAFCRQLASGYEAADAGTNHDYIPMGAAAVHLGCGAIEFDPRGLVGRMDAENDYVAKIPLGQFM